MTTHPQDQTDPPLENATENLTDEAADNAEEKPPHFHGHRGRLRERFRDHGADAFQDYELLELLLFMAIPRRDVKPIAKDLLSRLGSLPGVMNAPINILTKTKGVSETTAIGLKTVTALSNRASKQELMNKPVLNSWPRLMDYCHATMAHETKEHFRVLFLNKKNHLIADEILNSGSVDHTPVYPREIMKRALELSSTALILVHNHPSGDPRPSQEDITMTQTIIHAAEPLRIKIHDHVIISANGYSSFKTLGLI